MPPSGQGQTAVRGPRADPSRRSIRCPDGRAVHNPQRTGRPTVKREQPDGERTGVSDGTLGRRRRDGRLDPCVPGCGFPPDSGARGHASRQRPLDRGRRSWGRCVFGPRSGHASASARPVSDSRAALTVEACHALPPCAVGTPSSVSWLAMARRLRPAAWSSTIR